MKIFWVHVPTLQHPRQYLTLKERCFCQESTKNTTYWRLLISLKKCSIMYGKDGNGEEE